MSVISLILTIVAVGVIMWLINTYVPMESMIKRLLNIVVIIMLVIWLLNLFGVLTKLSTIKV